MNNPKSFFLMPLLALMIIFVTNCEKEDPITTQDEPTVIDQTFSIEAGNTLMMQADEPQNAVVQIESKAEIDLEILFEVIADNDGTTRQVSRTVEPGMAILEEFAQLLSVEVVIVPGTALPPATNLNFVAVFVPSDGDNGFSGPNDWLHAGEVCLEGEIENEPDQDIDCLWEKETLWSAVSPRKIDLLIQNTGDHDMKVELEGPVGIYQVYNVSAAPALPQFQKLEGSWEGIVAIHYLGQKSPVNPCSSNDFTYDLCYK